LEQSQSSRKKRLANRNVAVFLFLDVEAEEGEVVAFVVLDFPESFFQLPDEVLGKDVVGGHVKSIVDVE
jgi:hypothetical protein